MKYSYRWDIRPADISNLAFLRMQKNPHEAGQHPMLHRYVSPTTRDFTAEGAENAENGRKQGNGVTEAGERRNDSGRARQQGPKESAVLGVLRDLCGEEVALSC
jgi:hypothetical protein